MKKILGSSSNPEKIALTIKGIIVSIIPVLVIIFTNYKIDITSDQLLEVTNSLFAIFGAVMTSVGLIRKLVLKVKNK